MAGRDPRYDVLFEPVPIGPVTAPNRFYQVPHCNGTGDTSPRAVARMRGIKAEGGWGVVSTETIEVSATTELRPFPSLHLWHDDDIPLQSLAVEAIHEHGALAAAELGHYGIAAGNRYSRVPPIGPASIPIFESLEPVQSRTMDKADIRELRRLHKNAAIRAKACGFDIVYVYCAHNLSIAQHFLVSRYNQRSDEYGGSLENRARLLREMIEDAKDAVGDRCAVACRLAVDEMMGDDGLTFDGEGREVIEMLAEVPDLWDVNISDWSYDSQTSRFAKEGFQEPFTKFVKQVTSKPVVGVGRYTSPDKMVSLIKSGHLDFIGAARPSIADPFLPKKIEEGRPEDIRECIGCNICVSGEMSYTPSRCTQNPTFMEEWRRDWHPERFELPGSSNKVLVVGAGPAGMDAALTAARRGYHVTLAEAGSELGGRVTRESSLPGLAEWARVRDWRDYQLRQRDNVEIYLDSHLTAADVRELGAQHILIATGARWRRDGTGRSHTRAIPGAERALCADDIMDGPFPDNPTPEGPVVIYDDDGTYLSSVLAEKIKAAGNDVAIVTPAAQVAPWTSLTLEQHMVLTRMVEAGIAMYASNIMTAINADTVTVADTISGKETTIPAATVVMVTARDPVDGLYHDLASDTDALSAAGIQSLTRIGDCLGPNTIAAAIHSGHSGARLLDTTVDPDRPYKRESFSA